MMSPNTVNMAPHHRLIDCILASAPDKKLYNNNKIPMTRKNIPITNRRSNNLFMMLKEDNIEY